MRRYGSMPLAGLALLLLGAGAAQAVSPPAVTPLGAYDAALTAPGRVATDAGGALYVTEPAAGQVVVFDAFGRVRTVQGGFAEPLAIAIDASGRIVLGERRRGRVAVFNPDWSLLYVLGSGDGEFQLPGFIALDPVAGSDTIWVSDGAANQVRVYTNGALAFTFGSAGTGAGQFNFPAGIVVGTNNVHVVDQHNARINVFTRNGSFLRDVPLGSSGARTAGLAGDRAGRLFLADAFQGLVRVFDDAGASLATLGMYGERAGQLRTPVDAAIDPLGRLFVTSPNNRRVELYGLDAFVHVTATPANALLATGTNCTLSVVAGGEGPFTFQWRQGTNTLFDGGHITGSTGTVLTITGMTQEDAGDYTVVVAGPSGEVEAGPTHLAVMSPPRFAVDPEHRLVAVGAAVAFTATAEGDALTYQWLHDGLPVEGATNTSLELASAQAADAGSYALTAHNALGASTSMAAILTVLQPPQIVMQPIDRRAVRGETATLDVAAEGDALAYQWRKNGTNILAAEAARLVLPDVQPDAAGHYDIVVTNAVGSVTSTVASLQVILPPNLMEVTAIEPRTDLVTQVHFLADTGILYTVESSPDLRDWTRRTNVLFEAPSFEYQDPETTTQTQSFYRLRWLP